MKDNDTKKLSRLYDLVAGADEYEPVIITEDVGEFSQYLTEEMINVLGQNLSSRLIGLIKREVPSCKDEICKQRLEQLAQAIINNIERNVSNPMINRTLKNYEGLPALTRAKVIYQLLSTVE